MKNKYSLIRILLGIILIGLAITVLIGDIDGIVLMPYMLTCLGVFQVFSGLHFYQQGKQAGGIITLLSSIFVFGVVIKVALL